MVDCHGGVPGFGHLHQCLNPAIPRFTLRRGVVRWCVDVSTLLSTALLAPVWAAGRPTFPGNSAVTFCTFNDADTLMHCVMPTQVWWACSGSTFHMRAACAAVAMQLPRRAAGAAAGSAARWMAGHQVQCDACATTLDRSKCVTISEVFLHHNAPTCWLLVWLRGVWPGEPHIHCVLRYVLQSGW